ncbi:hypothetical protein Sjap_008346 [Stephania japonica]|uniref:Uncharacterized protein n=1 Tax=Stephania japonica TaxID=461633 RepID=A0AAP0PB93_9MAGN
MRQTAYEVFFTSCRSSPGFGGRNALTYYPSSAQEINGSDSVLSGGGGGGSGHGGGRSGGHGSGLIATSRLKRMLGLRTSSSSSSKRVLSMKCASSPSSPRSPGGFGSPRSVGHFGTLPLPSRIRRPLTSAEIMRQQMRVSEQSDNRLRKTLMRTLVGQMGRRAETIILPLELLRHLKPSEFNDPHDYHLWQRRQLKILETGLLLYPSILLDKSNAFAVQLRDIILDSEIKPIDTNKNSETMRALCNCVVSLSWRSSNGSSVDSCHWADGFPLNIHLYLSLMHSIFDIKEETLVLDDIDEMLELMKKTWSTLGINKLTHNVCLAWTLFHQYVATFQKEPDLLCATMTMLAEVANDAKRADREVIYFKVLSKALTSILRWSERRLVDYHESYRNTAISSMENLLPLALSVTKILNEDISNAGVLQERVDTEDNSPGNKVDYYIRSSLRNEFEKIIENGAQNLRDEIEENAGETFIWLANETEKLTMKEKESFSPILKRWHPIAVGVAAMTLHNCYGTVLKQYLAGVSTLMNDAIKVLERAGKLENLLVQMVVEDSVDCEDGGKAVVREMVPYEVDSIILNLLRSWINEKMSKGEEHLDKAKETETWNPKSKTKPYAQSAVEIVKVAKETVDDFFEIPIGISNDLIHDLADSLEHLFEEYTSFVASCGSKQNYVPTLPPLTRCNRDSRFIKLWKKAAPCKVGADLSPRAGSSNGFHPRPSTSRGTQRLYIRLNTLHYILSELHSIEKMLSLSPRQTSVSFLNSNSNNCRPLASSTPYFEHVRSSIQSACQQVSEVAAYRLIYLDSNSFFYDGLYVGDVMDARIRPPLRILKQNLTLLAAIVTDKAQPLAVREVMKATFEAFLMVLLAGGNSRIFIKSDHEMIAEDFESLKRVFCSSREGLVAEDIVEKESEMVEGIVGLMSQTTEQLIEDFSIISCEASGLGAANVAQKVPMPPTTGRWSRTDPNTILRVLCHRNDSVANRFLKATFQLPKRR